MGDLLLELFALVFFLLALLVAVVEIVFAIWLLCMCVRFIVSVPKQLKRIADALENKHNTQF